MHIINSIGDKIDGMSARVLLENCYATGVIDRDTARLMAAAVSEKVMQEIPPVFKDVLRAAVLKQMLLTLI